MNPAPGLRAPAILLLAAALAACQPKQPPRPAAYVGPTLSMADLVHNVNANNQSIPTLYAHHYTEATLRDLRKNKSSFLSTGGDLFVRKPRDLLFRGKKDVAGLIFEIGSTEDRYWMTIFANEDLMWWGFHRNAGKPCVKEMPFRPDLLLEVLGIGQIAPDFAQPPFPTMRFNNDSDVYMLVWNAKLPDRWWAEKEIWYDRATFKPLKVLLFDHNGRIVLRANLLEHQRLPLPNRPLAQSPWIATFYDLYFPDSGSTMTIRLSDLALLSKTGQPKPGMIRFPDEPGVPEDRVIQIDKDCDK